ncbi:MAG: hypothetical protein JSV26_02810 [bacterium]|nr:MAG: hypothetical protein JSV26_02810 [bacterium]
MKVGFFRYFSGGKPSSKSADGPCTTGNIGNRNFMVCLERGPRANACAFRCPFGNTYLCTCPSRAAVGIGKEPSTAVPLPAGPVRKPATVSP